MPKALVIRFSSIGDIVLTTPVVRCLKEQRPDIELHYLTKRAFKSILTHNPYIDKLHFLKQNLSHTIAALKAEKYDYIIDLHHNLRTFIIKKYLYSIKSYSFPKLNWEKWLMVNMKIDKLRDVHIVDRYLETVEPLGVSNDGKGLDYFIPDDDEVDLSTLPETHRNGFIAFVIGAKYRTKRLPASKVIDICKRLNEPVILLGGKADKMRGYRITNAIGPHAFNGCGMFKLNKSASLIRQATKVITNDTGLMHIAAAFDKEVVSIWGNTIPEFGMYPYYGNGKADKLSHIMEVKDLSCRPCSKIGYRKCPKGHFNCMELQDIKKISEILNHQHSKI